MRVPKILQFVLKGNNIGTQFSQNLGLIFIVVMYIMQCLAKLLMSLLNDNESKINHFYL